MYIHIVYTYTYVSGSICTYTYLWTLLVESAICSVCIDIYLFIYVYIYIYRDMYVGSLQDPPVQDRGIGVSLSGASQDVKVELEPLRSAP